MAEGLREKGLPEDEIELLVEQEYGAVTADQSHDVEHEDEYEEEYDGEEGDEPTSDIEGEISEKGKLELPEGADPTVTVRVDGEDVEVPLSEALAGYSRTESWTRKSQSLANERRSFEGERMQAIQSAQAMTQQLAFAGEVLRQVGMGPEEMSVLETAYNATAAEVAQQVEAQQRAALERGRRILPEVIPEWSSAEVASAEKAGMLQYALDNGFTEAEVAQVTNPRLVKLLRDAWKGQQLQERTSRAMSETRAKTKKAKHVRPGTRVSQKAKSRAKQQRKMSEAKSYASRTGRTQDAAAALLHSGLLDDMD
jgi:hypothetical protein